MKIHENSTVYGRGPPRARIWQLFRKLGLDSRYMEKIPKIPKKNFFVKRKFFIYKKNIYRSVFRLADTFNQ